jgi:hypothetical protein|tara:strand:- start:371 stop:661 length:291 start_codon:yes stop_codon:yes gene_type:complete
MKWEPGKLAGTGLEIPVQGSINVNRASLADGTGEDQRSFGSSLPQEQGSKGELSSVWDNFVDLRCFSVDQMMAEIVRVGATLLFQRFDQGKESVET